MIASECLEFNFASGSFFGPKINYLSIENDISKLYSDPSSFVAAFTDSFTSSVEYVRNLTRIECELTFSHFMLAQMLYVPITEISDLV